MEQATAQKTGTVVDRFTLKAFVEACLVLEEGVASLKDIEVYAHYGHEGGVDYQVDWQLSWFVECFPDQG